MVRSPVKVIFSFCLIILLMGSTIVRLEGQTVTITGNAPSYANTMIVFYQCSNWITGTEEITGKCEVAGNGDFTLEIPLNTITQIYTYLGVYRCYFFAEPGKNYQLILPDRNDKSVEDQLNPYFEPVEIHLGLASYASDDLNLLIMMFDDAYIPYYNKHVDNLRNNTDQAELTRNIDQIEKPFAGNQNEFFYEYRRYRYGLLKLFANQQHVQKISDEYFNNQPILYFNPAYSDLFNRVFDKYFIFFGRTDAGKKIYSDINQSESIADVLNTLSVNDNFSNDTLIELIILKQLHDEFYGNQFSRNGILKILDSIAIVTHIEEHKKISIQIKNKITRLLPGYDPPPFELQDTDGNFVKLTDYKGKYVYLNFCTCQSYTCLKEFNLLAKIDQKYKEKLVIITIATDPVEDLLKPFLMKNSYLWKFLYYNKQPDILKDYDVRAYPTYFLIGPDGKLIFSPALSPEENFEAKLFEVMKARGDL
jgi:peroxiredoxin